MVMKFAYTIFYVENVEETISFYEKAFGFQRKFVTTEKDYGELVTGETTISFASIELGNSNLSGSKGFDPSSKERAPPGMELAFVTETIEEDFRKAVEAGAEKYIDIKEKPWGQKVGYLRDLNGILIEICTPMSSK